MNQILVTEKIYDTPDLKRKRKAFKFDFFISVFLVCLLFSYYIYAEYDKTKNEDVAKTILANANSKIDTTVSQENVLVVVLNDNNQEEIPIEDPEQPEVQYEMQTAPSGDQYYTLGVIKIPKIEISYSILSKSTDELLKISPGVFHGPNGINEEGNFCIAGHNYRNNRFFSKVPTLEYGDIIEITDMTGRTIKYEVYNKYIVYDIEDVSCTSQMTHGRKEITLITCTNDNVNRWVVKAKEVI